MENILGIGDTQNASSIAFDFTASAMNISFDFIFASEEYNQNFECSFGDDIAIILTDIDTDTDTIENYLDDDDDLVLTIDEGYNGNGDPIDDDTNNTSVPDFLDAEVALKTQRLLFQDLVIAPNPANDLVSITGQEFSTEILVKLDTIAGKEIKVNSVFEQGSTLTLDVSELPSGFYFIKISEGNQEVVKRVIKK